MEVVCKLMSIDPLSLATLPSSVTENRDTVQSKVPAQSEKEGRRNGGRDANLKKKKVKGEEVG